MLVAGDQLCRVSLDAPTFSANEMIADKSLIRSRFHFAV